MAFSSAALHTLDELLTGFHFQIPDYQRGYAWGPAQLGALWGDLEIAVKSQAKQHFTGIVLLKKIDASSSMLPAVELVDGQQRVISAITLANALARRASQASPGAAAGARQFRVTFKDNPELQTYFDFWILGVQSEAARLGQESSSYAANLEKAAKYFQSRADELPDGAAAQLYLDALLERFCLFVLDVQPEFDIHVAFETLNNRGKKLSQLELLKNRLIYLTNLLQAKAGSPSGETVRTQIHLAWKGIYHSLGRSAATQNHDDEFLRAHAISYFGEVKDADWLSKVLLEQTFSASNPELNLEFILGYVRHLEEAAVWWSHMHDRRFLPRSHHMKLTQVERAGFAFFKPLILAAYMRAAAGHGTAVAMPNSHAPLLAPVAALLEQVERYVVLVLTLSARQGHLGRAHMNRLARSLMRPDPHSCPWKDLGLPQMSSKAAIEFAASYVHAYIGNREEGESWSDPRFEFEGVFSESDVAQEVANRLRTGTGYYGWAFSRLLLLEYEESRRDNGNRPIALKWDWDQFSFDSTVEHIYPQTPDKDGYWNAAVPVDGRSKGLKNAIVHSLGNLLLLSTQSNSSLSNLPFASKTGRHKREKFARGSHSETEVAQVFANYDWNTACIAARGVAMLKFAERRWSFNLTDTPDSYASYMPLLFGEKAEAVRSGNASNGKILDNRALNPLMKGLLA